MNRIFNTKSENKPEPFLTLATRSINGWSMALCPEFEVSACGSDREAVVTDLCDMIERNALLYVEEDPSKSKEPLLTWSKEVVKHKGDISGLFKNIYQG